MKYGIMGGTFSPIHIGHLILAEEVRQRYSLDKVFFVPSGTPPHKIGRVYASAAERCEMVELAVRENANFEVLDIEICRSGYSYTVDTVRALKHRHPDDEFFFVTGADALTGLDTWHNFEELAKEVVFIGAGRHGVSHSGLVQKTDFLAQKYGFKIELVETPLIAVSSSEIRRRVAAGESIRYLVPREVEDYIAAKALYLSRHPLYEKMFELTKNRMSSVRFLHSLEVAAEARRLAHIFGEDHEKAELAGLIHDYCKEISDDDARKYIEKYGIEWHSCFAEKPGLAHGEIAAGMLLESGLVDDAAVLDAVRWHTYGSGQMSQLAKIVYVADITEPTRRPFAGQHEVRAALRYSLDAAILAWQPFNEALIRGEFHPNNAKMFESIVSGKNVQT